MEYGKAKGYSWTPDVATPWDGCKVPRSFAGRRAGSVDERLGFLNMGIEQGGGERAGAGLWRALPEDMHFDVVPVLGCLGLYRVGQLATRDGRHLSQWKRLQADGVIPKCTGEEGWYERVRQALCWDEGHVLNKKWRVIAQPLRLGDFVVIGDGRGAEGTNEDGMDREGMGEWAWTEEVGRVKGIHHGLETLHAWTAETGVDLFGPVEVETWKAAESGVYHLRTEAETTTVYQKQCTWVEGYAWQADEEEEPDGYVFLDERDLKKLASFTKRGQKKKEKKDTSARRLEKRNRSLLNTGG